MKVKSYAPRVDHLVADVRCCPVFSSPKQFLQDKCIQDKCTCRHYENSDEDAVRRLVLSCTPGEACAAADRYMRRQIVQKKSLAKTRPFWVAILRNNPVGCVGLDAARRVKHLCVAPSIERNCANADGYTDILQEHWHV